MIRHPRSQSLAEATLASDTRTVPLSLMASYLALRLAESLGTPPIWAESLRDELIAQGRQADRTDFIERAKSGMPQSMVPFCRSDADLAYASLMFAACPSALIRSEHSWVNTGQFQKVSRYGASSAIEYIDRSDPGREPETVLLDPTHCADLVEQLRGIGATAGELVTPDSGDTPLTIEIAAEYRSFAPVASVGRRQPQFRARLLTRQGARSLAPLEFGESQSTLTIRPIAVERLMELQAASGQGLWIELHHDTFRLLGPLPDLLTPGSRSEFRLDPVGLFGQALGGLPSVTLNVSRNIALQMIQFFRWLTCPDPFHWRDLIEPIR